MGKHGGKQKAEKVDWAAVIDQAWGSDSETAEPNGRSRCSPAAMPEELAGCGCLNGKAAAVSDLTVSPEVREPGQPLGKEVREPPFERDAGTKKKAGAHRRITPTTRAQETPHTTSDTAERLPETRKRKPTEFAGSDCTTESSKRSQGDPTAKSVQKETLSSENNFAGKLQPEDPLQPLLCIIPEMRTNVPDGATTGRKSKGTAVTALDEGHVSVSKDRDTRTTLDSKTNTSDILSYADTYTHSRLSEPMEPLRSSENIGSETPSNPPNVTGRKITRKLFPIFNALVDPPTSAKATTVGKQAQRENRRKRRAAAAGDDGAGRPGVKRPRLALHRSRKENMEQLHLDLGQKTFGHVTCEVCGMVYTFGQADDQVEHIKFHKNFVSGVKFMGWKNERVVRQFHDGRIIVILRTDPKHHLKKVDEILTVVDGELGYAVGATARGKTSKVFLFISTNKIVMGCIVAETISEGCRVLSPESSSSAVAEGLDLSAWYCSPTPEPAMVGINRMWVSAHFRRRGVATRLLDTVRTEFLPGCVVPTEKIAFSDPTPDGRAFAARYTRTQNFLVYRWL